MIEIKKSSNSQSSDHDIQKLNAFKSQLGYQYAAFIKFNVDEGKIGAEPILDVVQDTAQQRVLRNPLITSATETIIRRPIFDKFVQNARYNYQKSIDLLQK